VASSSPSSHHSPSARLKNRLVISHWNLLEGWKRELTHQLSAII
jgi:hypothetical protein